MINLYWIASIWRQNDLKCWVTSQTIQTAKLQKWSTYTELHRFDVKTSKNDELRRKPFRTAKLQKWSTYTELHRFDVKTIYNDELRRKPFKTAKLQKWSTYTELHRFDVKTSKNDELRRKTFKTTQNYESDQIIMNCIDLTSKRSTMMSYVAKHSKQRQTTKVIKIQWLASIWRQNEQKWWVTSQNIQNYAKLRKWSNYNKLHRFDVKTI